jgi:hypothetical protein
VQYITQLIELFYTCALTIWLRFKSHGPERVRVDGGGTKTSTRLEQKNLTYRQALKKIGTAAEYGLTQNLVFTPAFSLDG